MHVSGFDNFAEEVGISRESSLKKGMSLDVQYDEEDMLKVLTNQMACSINQSNWRN